MPPAPTGPTVHRRQLGAELRRLRMAANLRAEEVAAELECSPTRVSRIENGRGGAVAKPTDVRRMAKLYGINDERQVEMLLDMLTSSQKRGWWETYEDVLPSGLEVYVGLETDARTERAWEPLVIHGLLQTSDYARALYQSWGTHSPSDFEALVDIRMHRQKSLERDVDALDLWAILDEAAIRRPIGGRQIMHHQLLHLIELAERPNITLQVLPYDKGGHPGLGGPFSILEFEEDSPVVYVESPAGNLYLEKRPDVRLFSGTFDRLRAVALAPDDDTTALLHRAAEEIQ